MKVSACTILRKLTYWCLEHQFGNYNLNIRSSKKVVLKKGALKDFAKVFQKHLRRILSL